MRSLRGRALGLWLGLSALAPATGCVTQGTYDAKVAQMDKLLREAGGREKDLGQKVADLKQRVAGLEKDLADTEGRLKAATTERDTLRRQLDDQTALVSSLKERLEKLGQNVDKLTSERGQLAQGLNEAKARLEELRRQKAAAEARAATFRELVAKLRGMIDAGQLKVVIRDGRMLIALPNDVLFDSGKTQIKPEGQVALGRVAQVLASINDRRFQVVGHTDNVPIKTARFRSNWELSTARAVEVATFMVENGMKPQALTAAGASEYDPVAPNDTPEQRGQNRRIEIILLPNIQDLPPIDNRGAGTLANDGAEAR